MGLVEKEQLFPVLEERYGPNYKDHFIEIYKMYVEMADRVSSRRQTANSFYLTVNTAIIGAATFVQIPAAVVEGVWLVAVAGVALCVMWIRNIQSYKDLNSEKFLVINKIERHLPIAPYDAEWEILQRGNKKSSYRPFHTVEKYVPQIFIMLYITIMVLSVDWSGIWNALRTGQGSAEAPRVRTWVRRHQGELAPMLGRVPCRGEAGKDRGMIPSKAPGYRRKAASSWSRRPHPIGGRSAADVGEGRRVGVPKRSRRVRRRRARPARPHPWCRATRTATRSTCASMPWGRFAHQGEVKLGDRHRVFARIHAKPAPR